MSDLTHLNIMCTGRIVNGMNVVDKMEEGTANREDGALPIVIVIKDCGETIKKDKKTS